MQQQHIAMNRKRATQRREAKGFQHCIINLWRERRIRNERRGWGRREWEMSDSRKDGRAEMWQTEFSLGKLKSRMKKPERMGLNIEIIRLRGSQERSGERRERLDCRQNERNQANSEWGLGLIGKLCQYRKIFFPFASCMTADSTLSPTQSQ